MGLSAMLTDSLRLSSRCVKSLCNGDAARIRAGVLPHYGYSLLTFRNHLTNNRSQSTFVEFAQIKMGGFGRVCRLKALTESLRQKESITTGNYPAFGELEKLNQSYIDTHNLTTGLDAPGEGQRWHDTRGAG